MSRSPASSADKDAFEEYRTSWKAINQLLRQGRSFSGHERNCVFLNCRGERFANVSAVTGLDFDDDGRALSLVDWDQDGDLDAWIHNRTGPRLRLMRNETIGEAADSERSFVAFRLQGTHSNRDAIGARVSVTLAGSDSRAVGDSNNGDVTLIQTLRAGDAFLSQSSKWLHFGLGDASEVRNVEVRWPSGAIEQFTNIEPGRRYGMEEGSGEAVELPNKPRELALTPSDQPKPPADAATRTFFANRLPMPLLPYETLDERQPRQVDPAGQPTLVTLWASWCAPCLVELKDFANQADALRQADVEVLALSVDGLDPAHDTKAADARAALQRLEFPWPTGVATVELLDKLDLVEALLFNRQSALAVPTSYLLDGNGELAAVYRGAVSLDQLRSDLARLKLPVNERREMAVPLAGRWLTPPRQIMARAVGREFQRYGYEADFARYLELDASLLERRRESAQSPEQRQELDRQYAAANYNLGLALVSAGDAAEAVPYFRRAVEVQPDHAEALVNLGALLARGGQPHPAIDFLQRALDANPQLQTARTNLAAALSATGRFAEAADQYEILLEETPDDARAQSQLARALLELGQLESAAVHLRRAVELNPQDGPALISLAWLQATAPDAALRDGASARAIAERLNAAARGKNLIVLDLLAAAQAEQSDFEAARQTVQRALNLLPPSDSEIRQTLQQRLDAYQANQPWRDDDGKHP